MPYNASIHTATNKPVGLSGKPIDARSYYYDAVNFVYRPYVSTSEVLAYLDTAVKRAGHFSIIINTGGVLSNGVIAGGTNSEYWFKDGVADASLVKKSSTITLDRTEANLLQDDNDQWYLPVVDDDDNPIAANAAFVMYNGRSLPGLQLNDIDTPNRIEGFINNEAATIKVTIF